MLKNKLSVIFEDEQTVTSNEPVTSEFKTITDEEANRIILSDAKEYKQFQKLYTNLNQSFEYAVHNPLDGAKEGDFPYHILIVNYMQAWRSKKFPMIKNRLLLTTSSNDVNGESFNVIPFNKSMVVIAPKSKIEDCFSNVTINLGMKFEQFQEALNTVLNIANNKENTIEQESYKLVNKQPQKYNSGYTKFFEALSKFDAFIQSDKQTIEGITSNMFNKENQDGAMSILEYLSAKSITLTDMLEKLFDPDANNFKIIPFSKLIIGEIKDKLIWCSNKSLVVRESSYEHLDFHKKENNSPNQDQSSVNSQEVTPDNSQDISL